MTQQQNARRPPRPTREVVRLTPGMFRAFRDKLPKPFVTDNTTDLQAGFQLGIQFALQRLQEGFTHEEG